MRARTRLLSYAAAYTMLVGVACQFAPGLDERPAEGTAAPGRHRGYVWGPDDGEWHVVPPEEGRSILKASPRSRVSQLVLFADQAPPWDGPPLHRHDNADEIFYVLSGGGIWTMNGQAWDVEAGETVFVPRGTWHTYRTTAESTELLYVMSAPGLDEYLRAISGVVGGPPAQPVTRELAERFRSTACYHDGPVECSGLEPDVPGYVLTRDEGEIFAADASGRRTIVKASPETGSASLLMFTHDIPAGAGLPPRETGDAEEILYVESGAGTATLNGFRFALARGSLLFAPPGVGYGVENPDERMRIVGFAGRPGLEEVWRRASRAVLSERAGLTLAQIREIDRMHRRR
jgi:quercetin dioxygenase-like cupin family protein